MKAIPNCIPYLAGSEMSNLQECIDTGWISSVGPFVDRFEKEFAGYHQLDMAVAVSSGTAALHLGMHALGVKRHDLVLCPTITFVGSVSPIKYLGADPVFLDVEEKTLNLDAQCLEDFLKNETVRRNGSLVYKRSERRIGALVVVHLYGNPADMDPILELSKRFGVPVLEDAAESLGARYKGGLVGTLGDVGCFSFNGNKVITSGGGGMVISRDVAKARYCKHLSTQAKCDDFEFIHDAIAYNYRLSNLCAAVGSAQFDQLDRFISLKRKHAGQYRRLLSAHLNLKIISEPPNCYGTYWMILGQRKGDITDKTSVIEDLRMLSRNGIGVRPIWYPNHLQPPYRDALFHGTHKSYEIYQSTFCLPSSVGLRDDEIATVVQRICETFQ